MATLVLHLKQEFFEAIREGSKREEYRLRTPYWTRRLLGRAFERIELCCGYPKHGDTSRRLYRRWKGMRVTAVQHVLFGEQPVNVFAIDVSEAFPLTPHEARR